VEYKLRGIFFFKGLVRTYVKVTCVQIVSTIFHFSLKSYCVIIECMLRSIIEFFLLKLIILN